MPNSNSTVNKKGFLSEILPVWVAIFGLVFATGSLVAQETDSADDPDQVVEEDGDEEDAEKTKEEASEDEEEAVSESDDEATEEVLEEDVVNEDDETTETESASTYEDEEMEEIVTTGTRMPVSDPTALTEVFTAEQIESMGVSDLSDFFRRVVSQFNSTNPGTSTGFNNGDQLGGDSGGLYYRPNLATVNLHAMGSGNTLVLLDGNRVAGFGGSERDVVNILGVPLEAIERVEIMLDGGSAVYGADAIAGVVNFITKKDYRGISFSMKQDNSFTGADDYTTGMTFGFNWANFRTTVSLEMSEREPIINRKTGLKTLDYTDLLGPEFDYRDYNYSQPGIVKEWNGSVRYPSIYYSDWYINGTFNIDWEKRNFVAQLPSDHTGLNSTVEDFNYGLENIEPYNRIEPVNGAHSSRDGGTLNITYDLTDKVELFLRSRYSENNTYQQFWSIYSISMRVAVPASNAYNPFGRVMFVTYTPGNEQETGILPIPYRQDSGSDANATIGMKWKYAGQNEIELKVTEGRTENDVVYFRSNTRRERYAPGTDEYYRRLSSPDPDVAFNLFGNGTVGGAPFADFLGDTARQIGTNRVTEIALLAKGFWFEMNGEAISYSVRYSRRATRYTNVYRSTAGLTDYVFDYNAIWNGISEPVSRNNSLSFELWFPLFSSEEPTWWGKELQLTIKNTRSGNFNWGVVGGFDFDFSLTGVDVWDPSTGDWVTVPGYNYQYGIDRDEAQFIKYERYDNAPSVGLYYEIMDDFVVRFNYSKNVEPPLTSELYDSYDESTWFVYDVVDNYDPEGPQFYDRVPYRYSYANPNLESAVSENVSVKIDWIPAFLEQFDITLTYSHRAYKNKIDRGFNYRAEPTALAYPEIAVRTPEGKLDFISYDYFNAYRDLTQTLNLDASYRFQNEFIGMLETRVIYNTYLAREREPLKGLLFKDLGTQADPDKYTGLLHIYWDKGKIQSNTLVKYTPGYLNDRAHYCRWEQITNLVGRCAQFAPWGANRIYGGYIELDVGSLTTVDFSLKYLFTETFRVQFSSQNLFNRNAPITIKDRKPYDATRWDPRGRVLSISFKYSPTL